MELPFGAFFLSWSGLGSDFDIIFSTTQNDDDRATFRDKHQPSTNEEIRHEIQEKSRSAQRPARIKEVTLL